VITHPAIPSAITSLELMLRSRFKTLLDDKKFGDLMLVKTTRITMTRITP
jgi:hypothetical protein